MKELGMEKGDGDGVWEWLGVEGREFWLQGFEFVVSHTSTSTSRVFRLDVCSMEAELSGVRQSLSFWRISASTAPRIVV